MRACVYILYYMNVCMYKYMEPYLMSPATYTSQHSDKGGSLTGLPSKFSALIN